MTKDKRARRTPPTGRQFEGLARHSSGGYLGGSNQPEPEMSSSDYTGMTPDEITAYVARLVRERRLVSPEELNEAIRADRRRGLKSGSRDRDAITRDHDPDGGRQAFRAGRSHDHGVQPYSPPKPISMAAWTRAMKKPSKARYEAAMAEQRAKEALERRRAAWPAVRDAALSRGASPNQLEAYRLRVVEGLTQAETARRMRCSENNVEKLVQKAERWTRR